MYQSIFVQRNPGGAPIINLWDDKKGLQQFPYRKYAYRKSKNGIYTSIYGDKLEKITNFDQYHDQGLFESDVPIETRVLIDLYEDDDDASTNHRILNFDIEVSLVGKLPSPSKAENEITAISMHDQSADQYYVYVLDKNKRIAGETDRGNVKIVPFDTERELLECFLAKYVEIAPTVLTGWNIDFFDIPYLYNRLCIVLGEDEANSLSPIGHVFFNPHKKCWVIAGVNCLDYLMLYKKFTYNVEASYRLDSIGRKEVNKGKVEYEGTLDDLLKLDIDKFVEYSLTDVMIVKMLDDKFKFIELCRSVCHMGHVPYEDINYSSRYIEGSILIYLRRHGLVAPNKPVGGREMYEALQDSDEEGFEGAYVKEPLTGLHKWVFSCDVNSLYPSTIRTLNISPETKRGKILNWNKVNATAKFNGK